MHGPAMQGRADVHARGPPARSPGGFAQHGPPHNLNERPCEGLHHGLKAFTPLLCAGYVCCGLLIDLTFVVLISTWYRTFYSHLAVVNSGSTGHRPSRRRSAAEHGTAFAPKTRYRKIISGLSKAPGDIFRAGTQQGNLERTRPLCCVPFVAVSVNSWPSTG